MGCLQIPRLIIAVEKLEESMRRNLDIDPHDRDRFISVGSGVQVLDHDEDGSNVTINTV